MELNEREAHCVARLIQGAMFGDDVPDGCTFCKFKCLAEERGVPAQEIRERLTKETGVDFGNVQSFGLAGSKFPHDRFLRNANDEAKDYYRKTCRELIEICDE